MNVLMIGAGMVAKTHVLALRDNAAGARLMGVLGRDHTRTAAFCTEMSHLLGNEISPFADVQTALAAMPDMAILITPPDARLAYARALGPCGCSNAYGKAGRA